MKRSWLVGWALATAPLAHGAAFDLAHYQSTGIYMLDDVLASEASAVTYNTDTGTLLVIGDEGLDLVEVDFHGNTLSSMSLSGFDDPEGLTYLGGGRVLIAEERLQDVFELTYTSGGAADRATLTSWDIGPTVGNIGLEGISYDAASDRLVGVKEKSPQAVYDIVLGLAPAAVVSNLAGPAGLLDYSDIAQLSAITGIAATDADHLLVLSQESGLLVEVDAAGNIMSTFDLGFFSTSAEGLAVAPDGTIFLVAEGRTYYDPDIGGNRSSPALLVLAPTPVPLPAAGYLLGGGLLGLLRRVRRRQ